MSPSEILAEMMSIKSWDNIGHIQYKIIGNTLYIDGTNSLRDLLGFANGYHEDAAMVYNNVPVHSVDRVVGYSMGAAIAEILSAWTSIECMSFAPPRYLPGFIDRDTNAVISRYLNRGDWVTLLPPWWTRYAAALTVGVGNRIGLLAPGRKRHGKQRLLNRLKAAGL